MSNARTIPWETIADWFAKNEQAIRDVMKFEGLRGAVNEVLRIAPEQPELAALREELAETQQISQQEELRANEYATQLVAAEQRNAELISAVRSINRGKHHEVLVPGDDEPQYRQRKEWVDWVLGLCDEASGNKPAELAATSLDPKIIGIVPMPPMEYDEP